MTHPQSRWDQSVDGGTFNSLLAVCDGSAGDETTLRLATDVLREHGGELMVMGIVERPAGLPKLAKHAGIDPEDIVHRLVADERERLNEMVSDLSVSAKVDVCCGKPFLEIIREVISKDRDLVIKAAEAWAGAPRNLFTSTDQHILRKSPAPVWLHMPDTPRPPRAVLAAVDVDLEASSQPDTLQALNKRVVETAAMTAHLTGAVMHVLHAWSAAGEGMVWMWSNASDPKQEVDAYLQSVFDQSRRSIEELIDGLDAPPARLKKHSVRGSARDVIPKKVVDLGIDILVMGSVARTGIPGLVIGNTAEDVLNRVESSVVIVKPPGYVSPVKV